jgi:hypothetical protein
MPTPPDDKIKAIKELFPGRALFQVDVLDGKDEYMSFIMTAPERGEYKLFVESMFKARETKGDADKIWAVRAAVENAALTQIRWPSREECMTAFRERPAMVDGFAEELQKAAGEQTEFRSKKL